MFFNSLINFLAYDAKFEFGLATMLNMRYNSFLDV